MEGGDLHFDARSALQPLLAYIRKKITHGVSSARLGDAMYERGPGRGQAIAKVCAVALLLRKGTGSWKSAFEMSPRGGKHITVNGAAPQACSKCSFLGDSLR